MLWPDMAQTFVNMLRSGIGENVAWPGLDSAWLGHESGWPGLENWPDSGSTSG